MPESPSVSPRSSVTFHLPSAPSEDIAAAAEAVPPAEQVVIDLTAAFRTTGLDNMAALTRSMHVLSCITGRTIELGRSSCFKTCPLADLPVEGWRALQAYVRATHGGQGVQTLSIRALTPAVLRGLAVFEDLESLHIALDSRDENDPRLKGAPAQQVMSLNGLRGHPRLHEVQVDCKLANTPWLLLAPDSIVVKGTASLSQAKVKVQYQRPDHTHAGDAVPLDGQNYPCNPTEALAEQGTTLQECTLEQFLLAQEKSRIALNCRTRFKMNGYVLHRAAPEHRRLRNKVVCRHLSARWLLDRLAHHKTKKQARKHGDGIALEAAAAAEPAKKRFSYRNYLDEEAIAEHVRYDLDAVNTHIERDTPEVVCHTTRLGESLAQMFEDMGPGEVGLFSIRTETHTLACELQVKEEQTDAGPRKRFVFSFYDPNNTAAHARMSSMDADSFKSLQFESLVGEEGVAIYCDNPIDPAEKNLEIRRVFSLDANGAELRRPQRAQTLLLDGFEASVGYLRTCMESNRHHEVSCYVRDAFTRWQQQPAPRQIKDLLARLDLHRPRTPGQGEIYSLHSAAGAAKWDAVAAYVDEVLKGAKAVGLPVKSIMKLLPPDVLLSLLDSLQSSGIPGCAQTAYSYLRPILDSDVVPLRGKLNYVGGKTQRGLKDKTFAQVGMKRVPIGKGELKARSIAGVGATLCAIVECKAPDRDKAALVASLGKSPNAILSGLLEDVKANPYSPAKEWLDRIVMRITPEIFGKSTAQALRRDFGAHALLAA